MIMALSGGTTRDLHYAVHIIRVKPELAAKYRVALAPKI